jgi:hypothetical protein
MLRAGLNLFFLSHSDGQNKSLVTEENKVYPLRGIGAFFYYCTTTLYPLRGKFSVGDLVL